MAASEWSEKKKLIVTAAVGVLLNAVAAYYLYSLNEEWKTRNAAYTKLAADIKQLNGIVSELPLKQAEYEKKTIEFRSKESKLPEGEKINELINEVSRVAAVHRCEQLSVVFQPGTPDPAKSYVKDVWHTKWRADFFNWCLLMNEMEERFTRFVAFENMVITVTNSGMIPTGTKHDIAVDIVTYRYMKNRVQSATTP